MTEMLVQCAGCSRHVKSCDAACPFCGAPVRCLPAPVRPPYRRMAAAAAVAASVAACASTSSPPYGGPGVVDYDASPSGEDAGADGNNGVVPPPSGVVFYGSPGLVRPDAAADGGTDE